MFLAFSNGIHTVRTPINDDYVKSIFVAHKGLVDEERHHFDPKDSELWNSAADTLLKLCNYHANFIRNELDLGTNWEWDYEGE